MNETVLTTRIARTWELAIAHIQSLIDNGWQLTDLLEPGPCFPPETVDAVFLVPGGHVRAFEIAAAPSGGFARVVRVEGNNTGTTGHRGQQATPIIQESIRAKESIRAMKQDWTPSLAPRSRPRH